MNKAFRHGSLQVVYSKVRYRYGELGDLPTPALTNKGFYWTWTGPANTDVTVADFTNGGGFDDTLQVGDWLQSDGTMYKHVPSDLMSKQRWESVGSFRPWVASGAYEKDTLVTYNSQMFRATSAIPSNSDNPETNPNFTDITPLVPLSRMTDVETYSQTKLDNNSMLVWDNTLYKWQQKVMDHKSLEDVDNTPPTDGQVLTYDDASGKWTPEDSAGGGQGVSDYDPALTYDKHDVVIYDDELYIALGPIPATLAPDADLGVQSISGSSTSGEQRGSLRTRANPVAGTPEIESWAGDGSTYQVSQWTLLIADPATLPYTIMGGLFDGKEITTEHSWVIKVSNNPTYGKNGWEIVEDTQTGGGVSGMMMWTSTLGGYFKNPWKIIGQSGEARQNKNWLSTHHYSIGELCLYNDELYVALGNTVQDTPDEVGSRYWKQLMTQYAKGIQVLVYVEPY